MRVVGPKGARFKVESSTGLGGDWSPVTSVGVIETHGDEAPVLVPIPSGDTVAFRQFRLVKE
jgi:hypothetical protein